MKQKEKKPLCIIFQNNMKLIDFYSYGISFIPIDVTKGKYIIIRPDPNNTLSLCHQSIL